MTAPSSRRLAPRRPEPRSAGGTIAGCSLQRPIGDGTTSTVWAARSAGGELVAIKVMKGLAAHEPMVRARFSREGLVGRRLQGPHFVRVRANGVTQGRAFLVTDLLVGETLEDRLCRLGQLSAEETCTVLRELCAGLTEVHAKGIIHRDVQPSKLFFARPPEGGERLKILDFGLACVGHSDVALTAPGTAVGSRHYMSPEQATCDPVIDSGSDVFSVGAVAYHCLVGRRPFDGDPSIPRIAGEKPPAPSRARPDLPRAFDAFFGRALATKRSDRFQTVGQLVEQFAATVGQVSGTRPATGRTQAAERPPTRGELPTLVAEEDYERFATSATSPDVAERATVRPAMVGEPSRTSKTGSRN